MDLYLIRHAEARPIGEGIRDDSERPLTDVGQAQAVAIGAGLLRQGVRVSLLMSSPLVRARQTAEAIRGAWPVPDVAFRICDELAPGERRKRLARCLRGVEPGTGIGLVGHEPDLAEFASWLIGSRKARLHLSKAGVAYVACDPEPRKGTGTLVWLISPEWFATPTATAHQAAAR